MRGFSYSAKFGLRWLVSLACLSCLLSFEVSSSTLHRGNSAEPASLDPHQGQDVADLTIVSDMFEGLVAFDGDGELVPGVAISWESSLDGKQYRFHLAPNLSWSDGVALTADDFVYSLRRALAPANASPTAYHLYPIINAPEINNGQRQIEELGVRALDKTTLLIELSAPTPYLPAILALAVAMPVPRHVVEMYGKSWTKPGHIVSNGAYKLVDWLPSEYIEVVRNSHFRLASEVAIEQVRYYPLEDGVAALNRFRAGMLDIGHGVPFSKLGWMRENLPAALRLSPGLTTEYLAINVTHSNLSDPRVRRALSLAIDREKIVGKLRRTGERAAYGFVPPGMPGYGQNSQLDFVEMPMEQRLVESRRLMAEAGYSPDKPLPVTLRFFAGKASKKIAIVLAAMWKPIGVKTALMSSDSRVLVADMLNQDYDIVLTNWGADFADASNFIDLHHSRSESNFPGYSNPDYDDFVRAASLEADPVRRNQLLHRAEALLMKDQPVIPIFYMTSKWMVGADVIGWKDNALDLHPSRNLRLSREPAYSPGQGR